MKSGVVQPVLTGHVINCGISSVSPNTLCLLPSFWSVLDHEGLVFNGFGFGGAFCLSIFAFLR